MNVPESDEWIDLGEIVELLQREMDQGCADDDDIFRAFAFIRWDMEVVAAIEALVVAAKQSDRAAARAKKTKNRLYAAIRDAYRSGVEKSTISRLSGVSRPTVDAVTGPPRETTARIDASGLLEIRANVDNQNFRTSECGRAEGLALWREVVREASNAPKMAQLLAAAAIAPFTREIGRTLPHSVWVTGPAGTGKTIALKLAAAIWGDSLARDTTGSLYRSWSASHQAVPQMFSELNIMPTFLDADGDPGYTQQRWGELIYRISLGSRIRSTVRDGRMITERSGGHSIVFVATERSPGMVNGAARRMIEIPAPVTVDLAQSRWLVNDDPFEPGLAQRCYGHLGLQIAETITVQVAAEYLKQARMLLPAPDGDAGEVAALLQLHLAGALLVDDVLGTGEYLTQAALASTRETLQRWLPGSGAAAVEQPDDPANRPARLDEELVAGSETERLGLYLTPAEFDDAKAAYLADWKNGGQADTFARWIAAAIDTYAQRTPKQRAGAKPRGRAEERTGSTRSFAIPTDTVARMRSAITADQHASRWPSDSAWCGEAIAAAVDQARRRGGGSLPTPPPRLPNRLVR